MNRDIDLQIRCNLDKWRQEIAGIIKKAFVESEYIDDFVVNADEGIRKSFGIPYSFSLETIYYVLHEIYELGSKSENCGYVCGYQHPYGFIPEAGCPVHDIDPIAPGATEHTHRYHAEDDKDYICIDCGARRPKFQPGARPRRYA